MLNKDFILHLSLIDRVGPGVIQTIIRNQRSDVNPSDLYSFSSADWMCHYGITQGAAEKVVVGLADKKILETELYLIEKHSIQYVSILEDNYPTLLREIYMPPAVLYWRGGAFYENKKLVAIVGSRELNVYGQKVVTTMVPELVAAGMVIVSGGARGIDTVAHETALKSGGSTTAVLGSGLLREYPASNKKLFTNIADSGGQVVSTFPLLCEALPGNFPARNRIISGLSHGCLVAQAAQKSGALITAHYALEQGRELFAIPGNIYDELSAGCHSLIQQGAKLVACAADIIAEIGGNYNGAIRDVQTTLHEAQQLTQVTSTLSADQKKIIAVCKKAVSCDDIVQETGLELSAVQSELFAMQLDGFVEQDFIGMWISTKNF